MDPSKLDAWCESMGFPRLPRAHFQELQANDRIQKLLECLTHRVRPVNVSLHSQQSLILKRMLDELFQISNIDSSRFSCNIKKTQELHEQLQEQYVKANENTNTWRAEKTKMKKLAKEIQELSLQVKEKEKKHTFFMLYKENLLEAERQSVAVRHLIKNWKNALNMSRTKVVLHSAADKAVETLVVFLEELQKEMKSVRKLPGVAESGALKHYIISYILKHFNQYPWKIVLYSVLEIQRTYTSEVEEIICNLQLRVCDQRRVFDGLQIIHVQHELGSVNCILGKIAVKMDPVALTDSEQVIKADNEQCALNHPTTVLRPKFKIKSWKDSYEIMSSLSEMEGTIVLEKLVMVISKSKKLSLKMQNVNNKILKLSEWIRKYPEKFWISFKRNAELELPLLKLCSVFQRLRCSARSEIKLFTETPLIAYEFASSVGREKIECYKLLSHYEQVPLDCLKSFSWMKLLDESTLRQPDKLAYYMFWQLCCLIPLHKILKVICRGDDEVSDHNDSVAVVEILKEINDTSGVMKIEYNYFVEYVSLFERQYYRLMDINREFWRHSLCENFPKEWTKIIQRVYIQMAVHHYREAYKLFLHNLE